MPEHDLVPETVEPEAPALHVRDLLRIAARAGALITIAGLVSLVITATRGHVPGWKDLGFALLGFPTYFLALAPFAWLEFDARRRLSNLPTLRGWLSSWFATWVLIGFAVAQVLYAVIRIQGTDHVAAIESVLRRFTDLGIPLGSAYVSLALLSVTMGRLGAGHRALRVVLTLVTLIHHLVLRVGIWVGEAVYLRVAGPD